MDLPGIKDLGDFTITTAGTYTGEWITDLDGMAELDAFISFAYGAGGNDVKAFLQTSLDQGTTAIDLWCFAADTENKVRARRIKPDGNAVTPGDGELTGDTLAAGIVLGDRVRVKVISTGTYTGNTLLSARAAAR